MRCALLLAAERAGVGEVGGNADGGGGTELTNFGTAEELVVAGSACELMTGGWACELLGASARLILLASSE